MQWPNPQEYNEAIQSPNLCFRDVHLRVSTVQTNAIGLPKPATGAFASVYKLTGSEQSWAVRLFHRDVPDQKSRYASISKCLEQLKLPFMAGFQFFDEGIRVKGQWYPMLKMDWMDGVTLDEYLRRNASSPDKIRQVAQAFRQVVDAMSVNGIAHGDMQHGNIMVTPRGLALVDYDGMYVPEMLGMPSAELGHKNYQHPYRSIEHFGNYTDNFSAWLIHFSLMMIAADGDLWNFGRDRECLIFTYADLIKPEESKVFQELSTHQHPEIRNAAHLLIRLANCPVEQVPSLGASAEQLQDLPQMDLLQQMLLKDKIEQEDSTRVSDAASTVAALETLSARRQMPKERMNKLWQGVSKAGGSLLSSVVETIKSTPVEPQILLFRGNEVYQKGSYAEAIPLYLKALEQTDRKLKNASGEDEPILWRLHNTINLQVGKAFLLLGDMTKSIYYFRTVMRSPKLANSQFEVMEASACLLVTYCEMNRMNDVDTLINSGISVPELSVALVHQVGSELAGLVGRTRAILIAGEFFERSSEWHRACSIYEYAISSGRRVGDNELLLDDAMLAVLVRLSRCYLYADRPLVAIRCLQSVLNNKDQLDQDLFERALLNLAVAQRQVGSRQDVISVLLRCSPRGLLRIIRQEMRTPLGMVPALADVVNEMAMQLGERGRSEEARLAVRLSADIYKNAEYQMQAIEICKLLEVGKFDEADLKAQDREVFSIEGVKDRFRSAALINSTRLVVADRFAEAFDCLAKYDCPIASAVSAIEDKIRDGLRTCSRVGWSGESLTKTLSTMGELSSRGLFSPDLRQLVVTTLLSEPHQIEALPSAVRDFADFLSSVVEDGSSHPDVLRLRRLALNIEEAQASMHVITPAAFLKKEQKTSGGGLKSTFSGAIKASVVSVAEMHSRAGQELDVLKHLSAFTRDGVSVELEMAATKLAGMHSEGLLASKFCERIADLLVKYFADSSGMRRWRMSGAQHTEQRKQQIENAVVSIMATFTAVPGVNSTVGSNLKRCLSFIASGN